MSLEESVLRRIFPLPSCSDSNGLSRSFLIGTNGGGRGAGDLGVSLVPQGPTLVSAPLRAFGMVPAQTLGWDALSGRMERVGTVGKTGWVHTSVFHMQSISVRSG